MKLDKLRLKNFRCFSDLELKLNEKLTVLVAENGQGKSTVLDAVRITLWPFVSAFDVVTGTTAKSGIEIDDVRLAKGQGNSMELQLPTQIEAEAIIEGTDVSWSRQRDKASKGSKTTVKQAKPLTQIGSELQAKIRILSADDTEFDRSPEIALPVVAYYGTGRLWKQRYLTLKKQASSDFFSRTAAYVGCLDSGSDYKYFADWFFYLYASDFEQKTKRYEKSGFAGFVDERFVYADLIQGIRIPVDHTLSPLGWSNLSYSPSQKTLVIDHEHLGTLKVDQLSDGLKSMIAMTADIAYRCVRLNPQWGSKAATKTEGIVMIDEVDMHLHPRWQQVVLVQLQEAFPKVQFIVTTHSPQVLSTIRRENIRVIQSNITGDAIADQPLARTYGESSGDVLHSVMAVDPQPPVAERSDLKRLSELVDQGLCEQPEAMELMQRLSNTLGEQYPQLQRLQRSIKRQQVLKG